MRAFIRVQGRQPPAGIDRRKHWSVPVIAINLCPVVDAATIAADTMETLVEAMSQAESLKNLGYTLSQLDSAEKISADLISPQLNGMF